MTERTALGDGRIDMHAILDACRTASREFISFDMAAVAEWNPSVISAVLLGAVARSWVLPFPRGSYERAIRGSGIGISESMAAFADGYGHVGREESDESVPTTSPPSAATNRSKLDDLLSRVPSAARAVARADAERAADYQDDEYAIEYLETLLSFGLIREVSGNRSDEMFSELARQLALALTYEDTIRVAELKIRHARFSRVREEVAARPTTLLRSPNLCTPDPKSWPTRCRPHWADSRWATRWSAGFCPE